MVGEGGGMKTRPIELIEWRDCVSLGGCQYLSDMQGWAGKTITTVGMVVEENEVDLVLAMSSGDASGGELLCNWMSIPLAAIISRAVLRAESV